MEQSNCFEYIIKYGIPEPQRNRLKFKLENCDLHVFGSTGALGLSILEYLKSMSILPNKLYIYAREFSDVTPWEEYAIKNKVDIKVIRFADSKIIDVNIEFINENSVVVFFLGYGQPKKFMRLPEELFDINVRFLMQVLKKSPKNLIYSSTSEIYTGLKDVANELSACVSTPQCPRGAYIESKRCAESILSHICLPKTKSTAFRIALASPPYLINSDERILSDLVRMGLNGDEIKLSGGSNLIRQFQYGPVAIEKIFWASFFGEHNLYNISGGEVLTLGDLATVVANVTGSTYKPEIEKRISDGAPDVVNISSKRLENDIEYVFPTEKLVDLITQFIAMSDKSNIH